MKTNKAIPILILTISLMLTAIQTEAQHRTPRNSKYKYIPKIGQRVPRIPRSTVIVRHRGIPYHYSTGIFYRHKSNGYYVVHAPVGLRVRFLPRNYYRLTFGSRVFFYYYGNYYVQDGPYYETVTPPIGARVDELPNGYNQIVIDGNTYYVVDGVYYKAFIDDNGTVWYEVVGINKNNINN